MPVTRFQRNARSPTGVLLYPTTTDPFGVTPNADESDPPGMRPSPVNVGGAALAVVNAQAAKAMAKRAGPSSKTTLARYRVGAFIALPSYPAAETCPDTDRPICPRHQRSSDQDNPMVGVAQSFPGSGVRERTLSRTGIAAFFVVLFLAVMSAVSVTGLPAQVGRLELQAREPAGRPARRGCPAPDRSEQSRAAARWPGHPPECGRLCPSGGGDCARFRHDPAPAFLTEPEILDTCPAPSRLCRSFPLGTL